MFSEKDAAPVTGLLALLTIIGTMVSPQARNFVENTFNDTKNAAVYVISHPIQTYHLIADGKNNK